MLLFTDIAFMDALNGFGLNVFTFFIKGFVRKMIYGIFRRHDSERVRCPTFQLAGALFALR
jgi:hypothetical protein